MATTTVRRQNKDRVPQLFRLKVRSVWRFLKAQPASFWLVNMYMFFEYVRPQSVWPALAVIPWSWATLTGAVGMMLLEGKPPKLRTAASLLLMFYTLVLVASSVTAVNPSASYERWPLFLNWILIYLLITNVITTERRFFVFMVAFFLYCLKMSQHGFRVWVARGFSFSGWGASGAPGWFQNSGEFGIQMCIFLPLMVEFILAMRKHWGKWLRWAMYFIPFTIVGSVIASSSRGALLGIAAVGLWWVARSKHKVRALLAITVLAGTVWAVVPPEQKQRFAVAGEDETSESRLVRWEAGIEMANQYPLLGIGYANWYSYYGPLSHNIFIEAWSELGYTGLLAFIALIVATFWVNYRTRRLLKGVPTATSFMSHMAYGLDGALVGYMASGFFVTVLYYPYFWINLAMTVALHVSARHERRRYRAHMAAARRRGRAPPHSTRGDTPAAVPAQSR